MRWAGLHGADSGRGARTAGPGEMQRGSGRLSSRDRCLWSHGIECLRVWKRVAECVRESAQGLLREHRRLLGVNRVCLTRRLPASRHDRPADADLTGTGRRSRPENRAARQAQRFVGQPRFSLLNVVPLFSGSGPAQAGPGVSRMVFCLLDVGILSLDVDRGAPTTGTRSRRHEVNASRATFETWRRSTLRSVAGPRLEEAGS